MPFLKAFLDQDHRDQILLQGKERLKQFLESPAIYIGIEIPVVDVVAGDKERVIWE